MTLLPWYLARLQYLFYQLLSDDCGSIKLWVSAKRSRSLCAKPHARTQCIRTVVYTKWLDEVHQVVDLHRLPYLVIDVSDWSADALRCALVIASHALDHECRSWSLGYWPNLELSPKMPCFFFSKKKQSPTLPPFKQTSFMLVIGYGPNNPLPSLCVTQSISSKKKKKENVSLLCFVLSVVILAGFIRLDKSAHPWDSPYYISRLQESCCRWFFAADFCEPWDGTEILLVEEVYCSWEFGSGGGRGLQGANTVNFILLQSWVRERKMSFQYFFSFSFFFLSLLHCRASGNQSAKMDRGPQLQLHPCIFLMAKQLFVKVQCLVR